MKVIILLSLVLYLVECTSYLKFERKNKCGCSTEYSCKHCAPCEKLSPICETDNKQYEDFYAHNLPNCSKWRLEGYNVELINGMDGTATVSLLLSSDGEDVVYEVELMILDDPTISNDNTSLYNVHSRRLLGVAGQRTTQTSCRSVLPFNFTFLYSGTYQLSVVSKSSINSERDSVSSACLSKPFHISSFYKKKLLYNLKPTLFYKFIPQRQELFFNSNFGNFSTGLQPQSTIILLKSKIDISLTDCAGSGNEVAKYVLHGSDGVCCASYREGQSSQEECPCKLSDTFEQVTCTLKNVTNGNYCVVVGFYDPRCKSRTIWTNDAPAYCKWSYALTAQGNKSSEAFYIQREEKSAWLLIMLFVFTGVILITSISIYLYKPKCIRKLRHGFNSYTSNSLRTQSSESSTISRLIKDECDLFSYPEILLLYPRDCILFMRAMAKFRSLLKDSGCKVYDPWDDEIYNNVVESCESWTLPFIQNDNVKIILVLSECSKLFDEAPRRNISLNYIEPNTLDVIFSQSLAAIYQYFCNRPDSYQRIFVVRLDGTPSKNFSFITPLIVYNIPQHLVSLMQMLNKNVTDWKVKTNEDSLVDAVARYEHFRSMNENYLHDILSSQEL